jgi:hypothetical protein
MGQAKRNHFERIVDPMVTDGETRPNINFRQAKVH